MFYHKSQITNNFICSRRSNDLLKSFDFGRADENRRSVIALMFVIYSFTNIDSKRRI